MRDPRPSVRRRLVACAALVLALALSLAVTQNPGGAAEDGGYARLAAYPETLPAGPGREIVQQSCLLCHTATLLTQQRKDSTAWAKTLVQMEKWDAPVALAQRDSLLGYLMRTLGSR